MALKSTIYKAELQIANMDCDYYQDHLLTIAKHPSETDERMMLRILVFALNAHHDLAFTRGLSTDNEPDLWQKNLSGEIDNWIDLGQPDEKRIRKACGLSRKVIIYCYSGSSAEIWWKQNQEKLKRFDKLSVHNISQGTVKELANFAQRTMKYQCSIQDETCWLNAGDRAIEIRPVRWK